MKNKKKHISGKILQTGRIPGLFAMNDLAGKMQFGSILFIAMTLLVMSCDNKDPILPEDQLSQHVSGPHFDYYFSESDTDVIDTSWQEKYYSWLFNELELTPGIKLEYFKYRNRDHLKRITGRETNGFAEVGTNKFHTIWLIDSHESVHTIVTQLIGHPPALFNEGIAVAHQADYFKYPEFIPGWNGEDFHSIAKAFHQNNEIPPLNKLLVSNTFGNYNADITYPVSGSFVSFLIDHYGINKLKAFITGSEFDDSRDNISNDFLASYGIAIETVWNDWKVFLEQY